MGGRRTVLLHSLWQTKLLRRLHSNREVIGLSSLPLLVSSNTIEGAVEIPFLLLPTLQRRRNKWNKPIIKQGIELIRQDCLTRKRFFRGDISPLPGRNIFHHQECSVTNSLTSEKAVSMSCAFYLLNGSSRSTEYHCLSQTTPYPSFSTYS